MNKKVCVANWVSNNVSVIDTPTVNVTSTVPVGSYPVGVEVDPTEQGYMWRTRASLSQ